MYFISYLLHFVSTRRLKIYWKRSYSDDHVRVVIFRAQRIFLSVDLRLRVSTFYISTVEKARGKTRA